MKEKTINDVCNSLKTRLIPAEVDQPLNLAMRQNFSSFYAFLKKSLYFPNDPVSRKGV